MRESATHLARRAAGSVWFRAAGSLVLLGLVALQVDWQTAEDRLVAGEWAACIGAVCLILGAFAVGTVRWHGLLRGAGVAISFGRTLRAYMVGMFTNNFLPTGFGGDATRALIAGRSGTRLVRSATSVLADRVTSVGCLVLLAWLAIAADPGAVPSRLVAALGAVTLIGTAASAFVMLVLWRGGRVARRMPASVVQRAVEVRTTLATYARQPRLLAWTLALGLLFQAITIAATWLLADSLGLDLAYALLAAVVPIVLIATVLPISLAGFGVREGSYVVLLGMAGVSATDATLLSLMTAVTMAVASAIGALPILVRGSQSVRQRGPASS